MGPKTKAQKMTLGTFLHDKSLGSWADEMEDLPSQPSGGFGAGRSGSDYTSGAGRNEYDSSRSFRIVPLPTEPPFTAHIGNLSYDVSEDDIAQHFGSQKVTSVRILRDREDDRPKGYGYVEFSELDALKSALELNGSQLAGRTVRVSVAEPPKGGFSGEDRTLGEWKRSGPLPPLESSRNDRMGFDRRSTSQSAPERDGLGGNWERKGPLPAISRHERSEQSYSSRSREGSDFISRGERLDEPTRADAGAWRSSRPVQEAPGTTSTQTERKPLSLKPRSSGTATPPTVPEASKSSKASPFGSAKPIDSDSAIKKIEEKLEHKQREQEAAALAREQREKEKASAELAKEPKEVLKRAEPKSWRRHDAPGKIPKPIVKSKTGDQEQSMNDTTETTTAQVEKETEDGWAEVSTKKAKSNAGRS
ncbi:putative RNA-binding protein sce3 [Neolecta irregularis DAH-3]|uniref:Putative RNA-binding protein sce3 n=1 Tax=Neolecta irregularis (strain DAH-3) TaxID=1198029 RepID=A0A1U7LR81_NEOID|nr:putative RNA-binding protein sce3 [Neolecta irregularis DAH-3]|eukprot:OLL25139.1 putative RNA-binding protein sce3 [Neolecta irregularis DAH-3]